MGSSLFSVLSNEYMEYFKEISLGSTSLKTSLWLRYVNDTYISWSHQGDVQTLLDQVNSIQPIIEFSIEKE